MPWLSDTKGSLCFILRVNIETENHHFIDCPVFKDNYISLWSNLKTKIINCNQTDGIAMCIAMSSFITNLNSYQKVLFLLGGLSLPFDDASMTIIKGFVASVIGKIHKLREVKLCELKAPWLTK